MIGLSWNSSRLVGALKSVLGYIVDEFEEWKEWFNSHAEPDGTFNLDKHPDLINWMEKFLEIKRPDYRRLPNNLGDTVSFDLSTLKRG